MQYLVFLEERPESFGAYVPDLPGCIVAESLEEAPAHTREAIEFHIEGLKQTGHQFLRLPHQVKSSTSQPHNSACNGAARVLSL